MSNRLKITCVILLAFLLNIIGIFYAYPTLHLVMDETAISGSTLKMISQLDIRPAYENNNYFAVNNFIYLPFYLIYFLGLFLFGIVHSVAELREMIILDYADFKMILPVARIISVLAGCLSVYLVYKISEVIFKENKTISLLAAFFVATSLSMVQMAHFGRVWIIQIMTILLAFYYLSLMLYKNKDKVKNYLVAGILIAIAAGTHGVGAAVYFSWLFVHFKLNKKKKFVNTFLKNKKFWLTNLAILLVMAVIYFLNPHAFANYYGYMGLIAQGEYDTGSSTALLSLGYVFKVLFEYSPLLLLLSLIGIFILFFKHKKNLYFLLSFMLPFYLMMALVWKNDLPRYISPQVPFITIIAALALYYLYKNISKRYLRRGLLALFIIYSLFLPLYWNVSLLKPNTFVMTKNWVENNVTSGQSIISLDLDNKLVLNENKQTIEDIQRYRPNSMSARRRHLLGIDESLYPQPNYYLLYRPEMRLDGSLSNNQFDYLIIGWWDKQGLDKIDSRLEKLDYELELVQGFYPTQSKADLTDLVNDMRKPLWLLKNIKYTGPYIEIYQIMN